MRKGIILLTVLLLPITIYLIFAISTIHYVRVPHYGQHATRIIQVNGREKTDTVYHTIGAFRYVSSRGLLSSEALKGHMYIASFIQTDSSHNHYNCAALKAYYKVNKGELDTLHFVFFSLLKKDSAQTNADFGDTLGLKKNRCINFYPDRNDLSYLRNENYFSPNPKLKTAPWKSENDLVLIDAKGCVRGYYDGRYAPEITRMIEDIKHIKFHDEAVGMEKKYTPVKKQP
jgi:protein SCO1/2